MADFTDSSWATCFQESAEMILGVTANELGAMKDSEQTRYDEVFTNCVFQEFNFKLRAKMETYNDEKRVKVNVVSIEPVDFVQSGRRMLAKIKQFAKTQC
jgi:replication factor A1